MNHFSMGAWVDFARDLLPETQRADMRRHLEAGCGPCAAFVDFLRRAAAAAREMQPPTAPPVDLVAAVKQLGAARPKPRKAHARGPGRRPQ